MVVKIFLCDWSHADCTLTTSATAMWSARFVSSVVSSASTSDAWLGLARTASRDATAIRTEADRNFPMSETPCSHYTKNSVADGTPCAQWASGMKPGAPLGSAEVDLHGPPIAPVTMGT